MANKIQVKRSAVPDKVPTTSDLDLGEIAINTYDGKMYIKKDSGTPEIVQIGAGGSGSGDVTGPASSTDNAVTRFNGTTGKTIQNSTVTLNDDGTFGNVNALSFDTTPTNAPTTAGSMFWDSGNSAPTVILNADAALQLGQENVALVYNGTGSTIPNGSVVAVSGAQGQRPSVVLADADSEPLSAATLGIATQDILDGQEGFICTFGLVRGINTSAFTAGNPIYLSQTAGQFTATRPAAPAHTVFLGWIIKVNASSGELFVNISNGWELDELHNVLITSPTSGNTLIYDASVGVWKNADITAGTAISVTNAAGSITIANTGVTSLTGTPNEIDVSASTGAVTLSLPATINADTTGNAANVTGTVAVANGGTGATSLTANNVLLGNGTSAVQTVAPGTNGNVLTSDGTTWVSQPAPSGMVYPGAGIAVSTGTAWGTSKTSPTGDIVGTTDTQTLTNKTLQSYAEKVEVVGTISTSTYNIDLSLANIFDITLGTNVTITFTNPVASGFTKPITLIVRQPSSSPGKTLTVTNAYYTDGVAPILSTGANNIDVLTYWSTNGGSFYFGTFAMANVS